MTELDHERPADAGEIDRVVDGRRKHAGNDSRNVRSDGGLATAPVGPSDQSEEVSRRGERPEDEHEMGEPIEVEQMPV